MIVEDAGIPLSKVYTQRQCHSRRERIVIAIHGTGGVHNRYAFFPSQKLGRESQEALSEAFSADLNYRQYNIRDLTSYR